MKSRGSLNLVFSIISIVWIRTFRFSLGGLNWRNISWNLHTLRFWNTEITCSCTKFVACLLWDDCEVERYCWFLSVSQWDVRGGVVDWETGCICFFVFISFCCFCLKKKTIHFIKGYIDLLSHIFVYRIYNCLINYFAFIHVNLLLRPPLPPPVYFFLYLICHSTTHLWFCCCGV